MEKFSATVRYICVSRLFFFFSNGSGPCGSEKTEAPTILAWEYVPSSPTLDLERKQRHGRGSGTAQTTHSAAGVFAATQLDRSSRGSTAGVCRAVSPAPGNPSFLLRQRPQESVLLSRLRARRRSDPLCRTFPPCAFSPKRRSPGAGTGTLCVRFRVVAANSRFLSTSTPPPPRGDSVSGTARITRSRSHRRTGP